jgi:uncharacterized membrane protein YhaH (DUF805 family)
MEWYLKVLKNYVGFTGRARRKEYWMFALISGIIGLALRAVDYIVGAPVFTWIYALAILLPGLAVVVRRLHDTGRSGWWYLIILIPVVGGIVLLVFTCLDSEGDNKYGPNPKAVA